MRTSLNKYQAGITAFRLEALSRSLAEMYIYSAPKENHNNHSIIFIK
jgi:hypothetical protein